MTDNKLYVYIILEDDGCHTKKKEQDKGDKKWLGQVLLKCYVGCLG